MPEPSGKLVYDLSVLPPRVQLNIWALGLDANTDAVAIAFKPGQFVTSLKYNYGGAVQAGVASSRGSLTLSLDPKTMQPSGELVLKGYDFNAVAKANPTSFGLTIGYGAARLPSPALLQPVFNHAWEAAGRTWGDLSTAPDNPMQFLKLHKNDMKAIGDAYEAAKKVGGVDAGAHNFGAGISFDYKAPGDPGGGPKGISATLWMQYAF